MWRRWICGTVGAFLGLAVAPGIVVGVQDALGYEVDPILGGVIPAIFSVPIGAVIGFYIVPNKHET